MGVPSCAATNAGRINTSAKAAQTILRIILWNLRDRKADGLLIFLRTRVIHHCDFDFVFSGGPTRRRWRETVSCGSAPTAVQRSFKVRNRSGGKAFSSLNYHMTLHF